MDQTASVNSVSDVEADRQAFLAAALRDAREAQLPGRSIVHFSDNKLFASLTMINENGDWCQVSMGTPEIFGYHNALGQMLERRGFR